MSALRWIFINRYDDFRIGWFLLPVGLAIFGLVWGMVQLSQSSCANQADAMGRDHRWLWAGGCLVETGHGYVPLDTLRFNDSGEVIQ